MAEPNRSTPLTDEERRQFLAEVAREFAALRDDPAAWEEELAERRLLDGTLMDGLDPDEVWTDADFLPPSGGEDPE
jgi:hypothetical protein